nr:hypothetical protein [Tanacetum cinerariifolium]
MILDHLLSQPRPDAVTRFLTSSLDRSRRRRFMLVTSSPRAVYIDLQDIWCSCVPVELLRLFEVAARRTCGKDEVESRADGRLDFRHLLDFTCTLVLLEYPLKKGFADRSEDPQLDEGVEFSPFLVGLVRTRRSLLKKHEAYVSFDISDSIGFLVGAVGLWGRGVIVTSPESELSLVGDSSDAGIRLGFLGEEMTALCGGGERRLKFLEGDAGGSGLELATQLANLLQQNGNLQPSNPKLSDNLQISIKLNSQNYAL